ncbi:MAG: flagellar export chaperone FlgN [Fimbriimonas ginsengisoli]|uniref:Flagellar export chaperone FlgN n=1 Tax=Fimbriimonas ginsengisoli TaxID=1005039 RepID=A0A931PVM8_FIMGI|nr:flagellar export chaperone FlgN [Fimbriimonas ginsengisoli]
MKTRELQTIWWDWLGTSERLLRSLYEQTAALTLRDVGRVERIQPELDSMMERMRTLDADALTCAKRLAEELGAEPSLRGLVQVLEKAEAQQLQGLANRVTVVARNVQGVVAKNRTLIQNEMTYIDGTLTLIAKAAVQAQGPFARKEGASVLVNEAA